ncbi:MAG: hypothetical protein LQ350_006928 [Teloschistes chrysophthalmus]|nr:MAG: hypothetical protein LQ350_006928 [Niorma chrysophthalma]
MLKADNYAWSAKKKDSTDTNPLTTLAKTSNREWTSSNSVDSKFDDSLELVDSRGQLALQTSYPPAAHVSARDAYERTNSIALRYVLAAHLNLLHRLDCKNFLAPAIRHPVVSSIAEEDSIALVNVPEVEYLLNDLHDPYIFEKGLAALLEEPLFIVAIADMKMITLEPPPGYESQDRMFQGNRVFMTLPPFHGASIVSFLFNTLPLATTLIAPVSDSIPSGQGLVAGLRKTPADVAFVVPPIVRDLAHDAKLLDYYARHLKSKRGRDSASERAAFIENMWPVIEEANGDAPSHARIMKSQILFTRQEKRMIRAGKGTIQRAATLNAFADDINALYRDAERLSTEATTAKDDCILDETRISQIIEKTVLSITSWPDLQESLNFFTAGMDSLHAILLLAGVINLIRIASISTQPSHLCFISSISSVMVSTPQHVTTAIPECAVRFENHNEIHLNRYAESKYLSELLLQHASEKLSPVRTTVARVGQLTGPIVGTPAVWNPAEWFPSLVISSAHLGAMPDTLGAVFDNIDWVPIDLATQAIVDLSLGSKDDANSVTVEQYPTTPATFCNVVNPKGLHWQQLRHTVVETLSHHIDKPVELIEPRIWLRRVREDIEASATRQKATHHDDQESVLEQALRLKPAAKLKSLPLPPPSSKIIHTPTKFLQSLYPPPFPPLLLLH